MGKAFENFYKNKNLNIGEYLKDKEATMKSVDIYDNLIKDNLTILDFIDEYYDNIELTKELITNLENENAEYESEIKSIVKQFKLKYKDEENGCIYNPDKSLYEILTITEASELWNKEVSTLRRNFAKGTQFKLNVDVRKSGATWLVTREAMTRIYGEI
ncbi:helix-turn-helix domain-containing protein [Clostridium botulinum]|uniref:helix-turn-helix domain-containing protein n=1 Tax=Clostridium botulinum TaxID=1491 RepID=UPI000AF658DA|nr:helix-turn-helix domain-containing protein [Clostridium botulinum]